jgi:FSR family fosmidomycin resistance protein-like MFS transporter
MKPDPESNTGADDASRTVFAVLFAISFSHLLNDAIQALLPSIYPMLKANYDLSFSQLGLITFAFQGTASLLQPAVGWITDRRSLPYSLPVGMGLTLAGLVAVAYAGDFAHILTAAMLVGAGSAIFHPEASRIASWRLAVGAGWRSPSSRWAETPAAPSAPCWRRWW